MCLSLLFACLLLAWIITGVSLPKSLFRRTGPAPSFPTLPKVCVTPSNFEGKNIWKEKETEIFWTTTTSAVAPVKIPEPHAQNEREEATESLGYFVYDSTH